MNSMTEAKLDSTQSLCPRCLQFVPAEIFTQGGRVYMRKACAEHGPTEVLVHSDVTQYLAGRRPDRRQASATTGDLTTGPDQAVCVALIDVTDACNLRCPTCFAAAEGHDFISMSEFERALDAALARKPDLDWLQLSGGEPTIHPQILDMVKIAQDRGVRVVQINTNGVRIARDDAFLEALGKLKPAIYLSFDSFRPPVYQQLRGANLLGLKLKAVERLASFGICTTLVCTVQRGLNECELGDMVRFAMSSPSINAVAFQPTFYAGRAPDHDPLDRVTNADVLRLIEQQTGAAIMAQDFVSVPCCNPACTMVTFAYEEGETVVPLTRLINPADYEEYLRDRLMDPAISELMNNVAAMIGPGEAPC